MADSEQPDLTTLTVQLLSAYFANNSVPSNEIAALIDTTRTALAGKTEPDVPPSPDYVPAVTVRKSLGSRDQIISMIDGKAYKTLKRHLAGHGLTPAEYRSRYNLPADYPMVAPGYSEHRREVAKRLGLGRKAVAQPAPEAASPPEQGATEQTLPARVSKPRGRKPAKGANSPSEVAAAAGETASADAAAATPRKRRVARAKEERPETGKVESDSVSSADAAAEANIDAELQESASAGRAKRGQPKPAKLTSGSSRKPSSPRRSAKANRQPTAESEGTPEA